MNCQGFNFHRLECKRHELLWKGYNVCASTRRTNVISLPQKLVPLTFEPMKIETLAVHAGHKIDSATGAVAAPIYLSTTFERDVEGTYSRGHMYSRNSNPNRQMLEMGVAALEGGMDAAAFGR